MIDFRYHVVSIVAIFLALTVGLVIGASILSGSLANSLRNDLSKANNQIISQQNQIKKLNTQLDQQGRYIADTAAQLVDGRLSGNCVAMVQIDGADTGTYEAVRTMVQKQSGALVCSDTTLNAALTAPTSQSQLTLLLKTHTPVGQKLAGALPAQSVELIAEALTTYQPSATTADTGTGTPSAPATGAGAGTGTGTGAGNTVGGRTGTAPPPSGSPTANPGATMTASDALATLRDFQSAGMITMTTAPLAGGVPTLAYVQAPASAAAESSADNTAYLAFLLALRKGGAGAVVGGTGGTGGSADKGGLVDAVIADATATREISTVDDTDVTMGQVASVFCLYDQSQGGTTVAGHYGTGANNDGPIPPITAGLG